MFRPFSAIIKELLLGDVFFAEYLPVGGLKKAETCRRLAV
jgi:hypothetical protein